MSAAEHGSMRTLLGLRERAREAAERALGEGVAALAAAEREHARLVEADAAATERARAELHASRAAARSGVDFAALEARSRALREDAERRGRSVAQAAATVDASRARLEELRRALGLAQADEMAVRRRVEALEAAARARLEASAQDEADELAAARTHARRG